MDVCVDLTTMQKDVTIKQIFLEPAVGYETKFSHGSASKQTTTKKNTHFLVAATGIKFCAKASVRVSEQRGMVKIFLSWKTD